MDLREGPADAPPGPRGHVLLDRSLPAGSREPGGDRLRRVLVLPQARLPPDRNRARAASSSARRGRSRRLRVTARRPGPSAAWSPGTSSTRCGPRATGTASTSATSVWPSRGGCVPATGVTPTWRGGARASRIARLLWDGRSPGQRRSRASRSSSTGFPTCRGGRAAERAAVVAIVRAKDGDEEIRYLRLLQRHLGCGRR